MRMLRWICRHTRYNKIRNEVIREKVGVTSMIDKMREIRLRWFEHMQRCVNAPFRRCERLDLEVMWRDRGRPK